MSIEIKMPALSPTMEEGTLARWLVNAGQSIAIGDVIAEIETDKATMELEATDGGVLIDILVPEGTDNVQVGVVIATMGEAGDGALLMAETEPGRSGSKSAKITPTPSVEIETKPTAEERRTFAATAGDARASALAVAIAYQKKLELGTYSGSGVDGRVIKQDIVAPRMQRLEPALRSADPLIDDIAADASSTVRQSRSCTHK